MSENKNGYTNRAYTFDGAKVYPTQDSHVVTVDDALRESVMLNKIDEKSQNKLSEQEEVLQDDDKEDEEEMDDSFKNETIFGKVIIATRERLSEVLKKQIIKWLLWGLMVVAFFAYFVAAMIRNNPFDIPSNLPTDEVLDKYIFSNNKGMALFIITMITLLMIFYDNVVKRNSEWFSKMFLSVNCPRVGCLSKILSVCSRYTRWIIITIVFIACAIYLFIDLKQYYNLVSLLGIASVVLIASFMSAHPSHIQWSTLATGLLTQFILGVFVMRFKFGYDLFKFLGEQVSSFLAYTDAGSRLVFGDSFTDHFFAFKAMPVIIFFSSIVNFLYYIGAIQYIILKLSWVVNKIMGTSPTESMNATANIFLGQNEAPLLIKPFLPKMTQSEIFAVMVGGFATVAGSVLAAYIGFGVPANHLITASIMAAPAGLAISKVIHPETKLTKANWDAIKGFPKGNANNILEAFSLGAAAMVGPIGAIVSNLIAFTAIFQFVDATVAWLLSFIGLINFGFSSILQYVFWPLAFVMGTSVEDCLSVGKLIGIKVILNELIAYRSLGTTIHFLEGIKANGTFELYRNGSLPVPSDITMIWNERSISIVTYALCGFANVASIGIQIGGLSALAPSRSKSFARLAFKAMIAGNFASFLNACISGLLFDKL